MQDEPADYDASHQLDEGDFNMDDFLKQGGIDLDTAVKKDSAAMDDDPH